MFKLLLLLLTLPVFAVETLDPIVVGSKQESKLSELTSSASIITSEEIETINSSRVVDVLNREAGIDIVQTGIVGGTASLFLRGMESRHVLILIDGVRIYDPTIADRSFNLSILNTLDIERVEIIKGAQSVLYGSDAIAGVVNFITKKGKGKRSVRIGTGYYDQVAVNDNRETSIGHFNVIGAWQESAPESTALEGSEKDLSNNTNFTLGHQITHERLEFETTIKRAQNFNYTDAQLGSTPTDDDDGYAKDTQNFFREGITYHHNQKIDVFLDISYLDYNRYNKYLSSSPSTYSVTDADGSVTNIEFRTKIKENNGVTLFGLQNIVEGYETQSADKEDLRLLDAYGVRKYIFDQHIFEYGLRFTQNQDYGQHLVYSLGYNYLIDNQRVIKSGLKTGFKAPSIYHQTDPNYGNPDLAPEKSSGAEVEYSYTSNSVNYYSAVFYNDVQDFIQFSDSKFNNVNNAKYWGLETGIEIKESDSTAGASLTLTDYDFSNGNEAARRPHEILKLNYLFLFNKKHSLNIDFIYRGPAFDNVTSDKIRLDAYEVWNLDYTYDLQEFKIVGSLKNIFDRDYETIAGYSTLGRNVQFNVVSYY